MLAVDFIHGRPVRSWSSFFIFQLWWVFGSLNNIGNFRRDYSVFSFFLLFSFFVIANSRFVSNLDKRIYICSYRYIYFIYLFYVHIYMRKIYDRGTKVFNEKLFLRFHYFSFRASKCTVFSVKLWCTSFRSKHSSKRFFFPFFFGELCLSFYFLPFPSPSFSQSVYRLRVMRRHAVTTVSFNLKHSRVRSRRKGTWIGMTSRTSVTFWTLTQWRCIHLFQLRTPPLAHCE